MTIFTEMRAKKRRGGSQEPPPGLNRGNDILDGVLDIPFVV